VNEKIKKLAKKIIPYVIAFAIGFILGIGTIGKGTDNNLIKRIEQLETINEQLANLNERARNENNEIRRSLELSTRGVVESAELLDGIRGDNSAIRSEAERAKSIIDAIEERSRKGNEEN
jgi:hypothetical protein